MSERKRTRRGQHRRQQRESSGLWPVLIVVTFIFGVGGFFFLRSVLSSPPETSNTTAAAPTSAADAVSGEPGEVVPIQGQQHVQLGEAHPDYNSDPPTSGWHLANAIPAGFYEEAQVDEALVHNLEHGHIVIAYDCDKLGNCDDVQSKLRELVDRYDGWKITVVPRDNEDAPLALTAWGRIAKLDGYDEARITAFIGAYRDQGPEKTPE